MPRRTPRGFRVHIGLFGRRNVGKSSLLNAVTGQSVSIVSDVAGTTTDPVEKPMELLPLGPVLFIDTAGIDDEGALGEERIAKTRKILNRTDVGVIVVVPPEWGVFEESIVRELSGRGVPVVVVFNKSDLARPDARLLGRLTDLGLHWISTQATEPAGADGLRRAILEAVPGELLATPTILGDLVGAGELAVLVTPVDKEAPKGRLILPQVQTIRDLLDHRALCLVTQEDQLARALRMCRAKPRIVVTDSQAFQAVASVIPADVPLTSFSILFARLKGDLAELVRGTLAIRALRDGDRVLIAEACTHHPIEDDIGTVKLPAWLRKATGARLGFDHVRGRDFPDDPGPYRLVVHCGACMWNRREVLTRLWHCRRAGVPMTNYGLSIAYCLGILNRALRPFGLIVNP